MVRIFPDLDQIRRDTSYLSLFSSNAGISPNSVRIRYLLLPRSSSLTIYKCFTRIHLDYGDVIYDQLNLSSLAKKIKSLQYNAVLAFTGAIRGTSIEKLYQELGFESLKDTRWLLLRHCNVHSEKNVVNMLIIKGHLCLLFDICLVYFKNKIFGYLWAIKVNVVYMS